MKKKSTITLISAGSYNVENGLRLISAYLKKHGHEVKLIFLGSFDSYTPVFEFFNKDVVGALVDQCERSDLIGFSLMTPDFMKVTDLTLKIKEACDTPIIWGGIHPTVRPEECMKYADMVCIGEGEEAMLDLANSIESGTITDIDNIWFKRNDKIIKNDVRPLEEDMDKYPFQDYDINTHFVLRGDKIERMSEQLLEDTMPKNAELGTQQVEFYINTTRGCPHDCTYCCNNALRKVYRKKGKYLRKRSPENIIEEIESVKSKFGFIKQVLITDDTFFVRSEKEIEEFCTSYKERIGLPLRCYLSPQTINESKFKLMIDAGLHRVSMGIQSYNSDTLKDIYKRSTSKKSISEGVRIINKYKSESSKPQYHIIVDNPWETIQSKKDNLDFALSLPEGSRIGLFPLTLYPGTELYERAKKDGLIDNEVNEIYLKGWTIDDVKKLDYLTYLLYFCKWFKARNRFGKFPIEKLVKILSRREMVFLFDNRVGLAFISIFEKTAKIGARLLRILKRLPDKRLKPT